MTRISPVAARTVGSALTVAMMVLLWVYGTYEVERCTQTCSRGAPLEACRFSCNLESSWPFIYAAEVILLLGLLALQAWRHLANRSVSRHGK